MTRVGERAKCVLEMDKCKGLTMHKKKGVCNLVVFFFFQAEDGIRDDLVTGVQTCALPIPGRCRGAKPRSSAQVLTPVVGTGSLQRGEAPKQRPVFDPSRGAKPLSSAQVLTPVVGRSEERRVGKECRSRWSPSHSKKKQH